ncbi:medium-chain fatty-acid--CoA ligase [soil metagenome]
MKSKTKQPKLYGDAEFARFHSEGTWGDKTIVQLFDERAAATPDKTAIVERHRSLTYREVAAMSRNVAAALRELGVEQGDVVAVQAPNWAELPIVHLAAGRIGAIFLPLSEGFREKELSHLLRQSSAKVFMCPAAIRGVDHLTLVRDIASTISTLEVVVPLRPDARTPGDARTFDDLAADDSWMSRHTLEWLDEAGAEFDADAPSHVMVSSGTTGLPRCSLFSDNNTIVKLIRQYRDASDVSQHDVAAALAPAGTGATGYNYPILAMLLNGGTSVMLEHWSGAHVEQALQLIEQNRCTVVVVVPAQLSKLLSSAMANSFDLTSVRVITNSGAKLPAILAEAAEDFFKCEVQCIYGTSEAGATAMTSIHDPVDKRRATVGRPLEGQQVMIVGDDNMPLPVGEPGEICWRGGNKSYGLLNDPEGTRNVWDAEGWLHSGDLGVIDSDGYLSVVGRKKDMIIRGGQNIHPGAIEEVLLQHPHVAEVAIVAFDDSVLGERIAACVVSRNVALTLDDLKVLIRSHGMAAWHQPELLVIVDEMPKNAGGKIDKRHLRTVATAASLVGAEPGVPVGVA